MNAIHTYNISDSEADHLLQIVEGHFGDVKSIDIRPTKLTKTLSAFANAEGGEVYIRIAEDKKANVNNWLGFDKPESANGFIQLLEQYFPLGNDCQYSFLKCANKSGYILKIDIKKTQEIKKDSDGNIYLRRGSQNLPLKTEDEIRRLKQNKGIISFETEIVNVDSSLITDSVQIYEFMYEVIPTSEPNLWLKKQLVLINDKPTVAGLILFADEPQAALPKRCGLKIYRYLTKSQEGTRETLAFDPISIEGSAYKQIKDAIRKTSEIVESIRINTPLGLENVTYPTTALHEIITNAVIHRDYSITDDIHIRIFDNRIEIKSPGTLPGHITIENILEERFARNGVIVRLINKFPEAPNKDVGEGLNTAFDAMRNLRLKAPMISQQGNYVIVVLKHEPLASSEEIVLEYLKLHDQIANREAREICFIGSENKMKTILQKLVSKNLIEPVPGTTRYNAAYRLKPSDQS